MALLFKEISLNKKAVLDLREYYVAPDSYSKNKVMLCKYGVWRYKNDNLSDVLKNIIIKLKKNENIGIVIADYDMTNFIKNNYNSIDFKRMIFIIDFDKNRAYYGRTQLEKIERDNKNNIVKLSKYDDNIDSDNIDCMFVDREYEEAF